MEKEADIGVVEKLFSEIGDHEQVVVVDPNCFQTGGEELVLHFDYLIREFLIQVCVMFPVFLSFKFRFQVIKGLEVVKQRLESIFIELKVRFDFLNCHKYREAIFCLEFLLQKD